MAIKRTNPAAGPALDFAGILRGTAVALAISLSGSILIGITYHFTGIMESSLSIVSSVLLLIGVFSGGFTASRRTGTKGLFHGLGVGMLIFIFIWILMSVFLPTGVLFLPLLQKLSICLVGGALGGIAGIIL